MCWYLIYVRLSHSASKSIDPNDYILIFLFKLKVFFCSVFSLHPEAYKYLKNFNKTKQELAERLFALYNRVIYIP